MGWDGKVTPPQVRSAGSFTGTTNGSGGLNIPHGLGVVPLAVTVICRGSSVNVPIVGSPDATNIPVTIRNITNGALVTSTSVSVSWSAIV